MAASLNPKGISLDLFQEVRESIVKDITAYMSTDKYRMQPNKIFFHDKYLGFCFEIGSLYDLKKNPEIKL